MSLRVLVPLVLLTFAFVAGMFSITMNTRWAEKQVEDYELADLRNTLQYLRGTLEILVARGDAARVSEALALLKAKSEIESALLFDEQQVCIAASDPQVVGQPAQILLDSVGRRCDFSPTAVLDAVQIAQRDRVLSQLSLDGNAAVGFVRVPFHAPAAAGPPGGAGVLFLQHDLREAKAQERRQVRLHTAQFGAFLVSAASLSWLCFHLLLTRRAERLIEATERFAEGDMLATANLRGSDELAGLSQAFDRMVRQVTESRMRLQAAHDELEDRVEQRTEELMASNAQLTREVAERRRAEGQLQSAKELAEAASRAKSEFLANMSHEIRTPLNGVVGMVDLLLDSPIDNAARRYAEIAKSSAGLLLTLINDILDFSKIEAGKLELEVADFDAADVVEQVAIILARPAEEKGLELVCDARRSGDTLVRGDAARLRQVLVNLVNNAIKFTAEGQVAVLADIERSDEREIVLRFTVSDTGIGIPSQRAASLFDPFTQLDATTTRRFGGTGLGLAISKRLTELMGGEIGVESEPGQGSTFWFTARFARAESAPSRAAIDASRLAGCRTLAVDDHATNREILAAHLTALGAPNDTAASAGEALDKLRAAAQSGEPFRLAIIDMHMPEVDGQELGRAIQADPTIADTVLVLLTSVGHQAADDRLWQSGFTASATKPLWRTELVEVLVAALGGPPVATATERSAPPSDRAAPSREPPALREVAAESQYLTQPRRRVLVVEDNEVNQQVVAAMLRRAGYDCAIAPDGLQAIARLCNETFHAVLMDCQLPGVDGFEVTRRVRTLESRAANVTGAIVPGRRLPIVAVTAGATREDRDRCLAAGMDEFLSKPIERERLTALLARLLDAQDGSPTETAGDGSAVREDIAADVSDADVQGADASGAINLSATLRRLDDDRELVAELAELFRTTAPQLLAEIRAAIDAADPRRVRLAAHRLRGIASNFDAAPTVAAATDLELLAEADRAVDFRAAVVRLEVEVERTLAALAAFAQSARDVQRS